MPHAPLPNGELPAEPASATSEFPAIPCYHLLAELGTGGMGMVYLAEQREPVRRRVALKVIKLGMDTKAVLARFDAERQALALMDHPSIAKVFDAGSTAQGRPYFAMEYVKGVPITGYCDDGRLSIDERLELFKQVCGGVQHAHQKGVIHRDLTPNNVLVTVQDGRPTAKIIDFGLARATDHRLTEKTLFTEQGVILGTPEYMSPEQAGLDALDVDMRSDVYTLGVLLYELLTGTLPFSREQLRRAGYDRMCDVIRHQDPERPSTRITKQGSDTADIARLRRTAPDRLLHRLRTDLDWIVLKCLEKDRTRRYETASQLAEDVQRHLDFEPVLARAPSARYRLAKLARRYRAQLVATGALAAAVLAGLAGTTSFWLEARAQAKLARERADDVEERRSEAVRERGAKEQALEATERALLRGTGMRLLAQSMLIAPRDAGLAVALADAGAVRVPGPEAERTLRTALAASREVATDWLWETVGGDPVVLASASLGVVARLDHPAKGSVTIWSLRRGQPPQRCVVRVGDLGLAREAAKAVALSPGGKLLAVVAAGQLRVHRTDSAEVVRRVQHAGREVRSFGFDHRGEALVVAWQDGPVTMVPLSGHAPEVPLAEGSEPVGHLVCATAAPRVLVRRGEHWEVLDLDRLERVGAFDAQGDSASLSPSGARAMVSDGWSPVVVTWDETRGRAETAESSPRTSGPAECWSADHDGRLLVVGCANLLKAWDLERGRVHAIQTGDELTAVAVDAAGRRVATGEANGAVRVLDAGSWTEVAKLPGHSGRILSLAFAGATELVSVGADGALRRWNVAHGLGRRPLTSGELHGLLDVFSPVDGRVFCVVEDVKPRLDLDDPAQVFRAMSFIRGVDDPVVQFKWMIFGGAVAADGRHIAMCRFGSDREGTRLLSAPDLREVGTVPVLAPAFSRDGHRLVGSGGAGLQVADVARPGSVVALEESADYLWPRFGVRHVFAIGRAVHERSTESTKLRIWNPDTGGIVSTCTADERLLSAALALDSALAVAGSADGRVELFDGFTGRTLASLYGHRGKVLAVAVSPDGTRVASGGADGSVRIWDVAARQQVGQLAWSDDPVLAVGFSDDGEWVVFGSAGGEVAGEPVDPRAFVASRALRALTPAESDTFEVGTAVERAEYRTAWRQRFGLETR